MEDKLNLATGETEVLFHISSLGVGLACGEKDCCWCLVDLYVKNHFFCFDVSDVEIITFNEVIYLRDRLRDLLSDKIKDECSVEFIEPDLVFELYPKLDLRTVGSIIYVREGMEIQDIYANLIINLTDTGGVYNGESYSYPLTRKEIELMKAYLDRVILELECQWDGANN